jgi:hypothetical protein
VLGLKDALHLWRGIARASLITDMMSQADVHLSTFGDAQLERASLPSS